MFNLENLNLYKLNITNLEPIKNLIYLEELNLYGNQNLSDISPLSNLVYLKQLYLNKTKVTDYSPVKGINNYLLIHK